ncbi:unnamed protein product, partial [Ectocarpus sp. 8 AP-2014]
MWRIFGFDMQSRSPGVVLQHVHLQDEQIIIHDEDATEEQRRASAHASQSDLMRYFRHDNSDGYDSDDMEPSALPHALDGYQNYVYRRRSECVCRVNFLKPDAGDTWNLRLLLHHISASSWEHIRTVDGVVHGSHQSAAHTLGLVADAQEYDLTFREALHFPTPRELRSLLVTLIIAGAPARDIWDTHKYHLMTDYMTHMSESAATDRALRHMDLMLAKHG